MEDVNSGGEENASGRKKNSGEADSILSGGFADDKRHNRNERPNMSKSSGVGGAGLTADQQTMNGQSHDLT